MLRPSLRQDRFEPMELVEPYPPLIGCLLSKRKMALMPRENRTSYPRVTYRSVIGVEARLRWWKGMGMPDRGRKRESTGFDL